MPRYWPFNKYPGTDYETFNWEWVISTIKRLQTTVDEWVNDIKDYVLEILSDHPEWIQNWMLDDGTVTEPKIESEFLKLIKNDYVTPQMYGAVADGTHDDTTAVSQAFNSGKPVYVPAGVYRCTDTIEVTNGLEVFIDKNAELRLDDVTRTIFLDINNNHQTHDYGSRIMGSGKINGNHNCGTVVGLHRYRDLIWDGPAIYNGVDVLLDPLYNRSVAGQDAGEAVISNCLLKNETWHPNSIGIKDGHDCMYSNIVIQDTAIGAECRASSYNNIHYWAANENAFRNGCAFKIVGDTLMSNIVCDTKSRYFEITSTGVLKLDNVMYMHNNTVISQTIANDAGITLYDINSGGKVIVSNAACHLYAGYTNQKLVSDATYALSMNDYELSLSNDWYLVKNQMKNRVVDSISSNTYHAQINSNLDAGTTYTFKLRKRRPTDYAHFIIYGGQAWNYNFMQMGIVNDLSQVSFYPIYGNTVTFTGTYANETLTLTPSTTLYGGIRIIWCN